MNEANLTDVLFWGTDMTRVDLRQANLINADMELVTAAGADLTAADARYAVLPRDLAGAITRNLIDSNGHIDGLNLATGEKLVAYEWHLPVVRPIPVTVVGDFSIAPDATFDLTDNALIIDYSGASPIAVVRERLITGRGGSGPGATWTGPGINSSTAAADREAFSVGYAVNADLPLGRYTEFQGQPVDRSSILIRYTRTADANLDGVVNDDDVTIVGALYAPGVPCADWARGDFDYNGFVDDNDVTLLGVYYNPSAAPLGAPARIAKQSAAAVPERATLLLAISCALGLVPIVIHRRRRG